MDAALNHRRLFLTGSRGSLAGVLARHFRAEPWRGYGPGPPQIFDMLDRGVPWDRAAASRTFWTAGNNKPIKMAMMAITTSNSINVKPTRFHRGKRSMQRTSRKSGPERTKKEHFA